MNYLYIIGGALVTILTAFLFKNVKIKSLEKQNAKVTAERNSLKSENLANKTAQDMRKTATDAVGKEKEYLNQVKKENADLLRQITGESRSVRTTEDAIALARRQVDINSERTGDKQ